MSKKYSYDYRSSSRKSNGKLIVIVVLLVVILTLVLLMLFNKDMLTNVIRDIAGLEDTNNNELDDNLNDNTNNNTDDVDNNNSNQEVDKNNSSNDEDEQNDSNSVDEQDSNNNQTSNQDNEEKTWRNKEIDFTRTAINVDPLRQELEDYIFEFTGQYGIHFYDLTSGASFGINDIDEYVAASTIKIPLNLYIYSLAAEEGLDMNDKLTYLEEDKEAGTGYIINHGQVGDEYSIRTLCKYSVIYSDNVATNMLLRKFTREDLRDFMKSIGGQVVSDSENLSCPRDMALYLKKLYQFAEEYPGLGNEVITNLSKTHQVVNGYINTPQADLRLVKNLPERTKVAHKIGNYTGAWHDAGIVFAEHPYVITVMTYGVLYDDVNDVIANISKKIYDYVAEVESY